MEWQKLGLIFQVKNHISWSNNSALQPSAIFLVDENIIRVFFGSRDISGISRIGFVDLNPENPEDIINTSSQPCLDIGNDGMFDDNGVVPCCVIKNKNRLILYYAGYQLVEKVRFLVFGGVAESFDNGQSFKRVKQVPIADRTDNEALFRVIHTALYDQDTWKFWYGGGSYFKEHKNHSYPCYDIRYIESKNFDKIGCNGKILLETKKSEYRVARPNVIRFNNKYHMFLCHGSFTDPYSLGYAYSEDGIDWTRDDSILNLNKSSCSWDSDMMAYPNFIIVKNVGYLFYNGNDYGKEGFGCARLLNLKDL